METILDPRRLAPLVKSAARVASANPRIKPALVRGQALVRSIRATRAYQAVLAVGGAGAARLKTSPQLSGALASGLAVLIFVSASPWIFRTVAPTTEAAPAEASTVAPQTPATPDSDAGVAGDTGQADDSSASPSPHANHENPETFTELFETLDESRWYIADRGPNGDWSSNDFRRTQTYITSEGVNVSLAGTATGHAPFYTSGEISTLQKFRYGYFEARMRVPRGSGLDTGLFTYVREGGPATWNEIDIEILGKNTRQAELTLHVGKRVATRIVKLGFDAADGFHTYAFDWKPDSVTWYVDGRNVYEERGPVALGMNRPQNFFFDLWGSETLPQWIGKLDRKGGPYTATVSCFAYAKSYKGRAICPANAAGGDSEARPIRVVLN
jgi:endo-1,3-1,4-beta-glycanase ExoK